MRIYVDYRALNKANVMKKYLVPLVEDFMDRLSTSCWARKKDLRSVYWQVG